LHDHEAPPATLGGEIVRPYFLVKEISYFMEHPELFGLTNIINLPEGNLRKN